MITAEQVVPMLTNRVPEFQAAVDEHLAYYEELLDHVLFGDLTRFVLAAHDRGDASLVARTLRFLDEALADGDEYVENLVAVSFVGIVGPWDHDRAAFIDSWPAGLRSEAHRQRDGRPDQS